MDRSLVVIAMLASWMLWQELLFLDHPSSPTWNLQGRFSNESACHEARQIRLVDQLLRTDRGGPIVLNQSHIEEGTLWVQYPDGLHARMRFVCLPETMDPTQQWLGHHYPVPSLGMAGLGKRLLRRGG
jgi:hypothetical protein